MCSIIKQAAEIKAPFLSQNPQMKRVYASHLRKKLNQNKTVQLDLAQNSNLAPSLTKILL